jgi:hypothetical protein
MKLLLACLVYLAVGIVLAAGIVLAVKGSYWLLAAAVIAYLLAFARFGCVQH